jgi:hypothetical protein
MMSKQLLWPVYEFRPLPGFFVGPVRRYADGAWIEDDGEHDLAFINESGAPVCLYVCLPYRKNIICSWTTGHWSAFDPAHPNGNAWHYALRDGEKDWGDGWGRDSHPNERAGRAGMDKLVGERRCANGRHVEFHANDKHIAAGLMRERDTGNVFRFADDLTCMYCGKSPSLISQDSER